MVVDKDAVISSTWQTIYNYLSTNLVDPKNRGVKWIFGTYPDTKSKRFPGWPVVVIESPDVRLNHMSVGKSLKEWPIRIRIAVYTDWAEHADSIADQVVTILRQNEANLEQEGLYNFKVTASPIEAINLEGNRIYGKAVRCSFQFVEAE
ncbi:MAG TPA: hypothetical protein ENG10_04745 [Candidatus Bathyarchaeota archaeon]|nr:hypothetical protein [Candidatus Bathyarchaeota archaeon]HEX69583.1 hypothetical protein [Candidatus Bathyarchaeota archaeon]